MGLNQEERDVDISTVAVTKFRKQHRGQISEKYNGIRHFIAIHVGSLVPVIVSIFLGGSKLLAWGPALTMIVTFLFANYVEWKLHTDALHSKTNHSRHVVLHHRFFTHQHMSFDELQLDTEAIFFHPLFSVIVFWVICPIIAAVLSLFFGLANGLSFLITGSLYYLIYEWLHLMYHSPPTSILGRLPGIAYLRHHHMVHHNQTLMGTWNYNITFPIMDWFFNTTYSPNKK